MKDMTKAEFIKAITDLRKRTGLSRQNFAKQYEIPKRTLENWEFGQTQCPDYVFALLKYRVETDFPDTSVKA